MATSKPTFVFDFDDFSPKNTNFSLFEKIREHVPGFKVTLFTVPWDARFGDATPITLDKYQPFCTAMQKAADWMEVALHGLTHIQSEFKDLTYTEAQKRILVGEKMFINRGIPYTKLFKAPFWQLSESGKRAAEELGFMVAEDHYYNWNLKDTMPKTTINKNGKNYIVAHGHIQDTDGNGLEESLFKILNLPSDSQFAFLSEFFGSERVDPKKLDFSDPLTQFQVYKDGVLL